MLSAYKNLSSDPNFPSFYLAMIAVAIACIFFHVVLSRYFAANRDKALGLNVHGAEKRHHSVRASEPSPQSVPRAAPKPEATKCKVWWTANTVPGENVSFQVGEPELERSESIERRTKPQRRGEPIEESMAEIMSAPGRRLPYFFFHNYFCIAHEAIDIFERHDLGSAQFRDVEFYEFGGSRRVNERLKILVPCNPKSGFLLEDSPDVKKKSLGTPALLQAPMASYHYGNGDIAVSKSVLDGADVWIDPTFRNTFFMSDRLARALKQAGLAEDFDLRWARVL